MLLYWGSFPMPHLPFPHLFEPCDILRVESKLLATKGPQRMSIRVYGHVQRVGQDSKP